MSVTDIVIPAQDKKFLVALVGAALTTFIAVFHHGSPLFVVLSILIAVAQAAATLTPNADTGFWHYAKTWFNVLGVIAQAVLLIVGTSLGLDALTPVDFAAIALAALQALGVFETTNTPMIDARETGVVTTLGAEPLVVSLSPDDRALLAGLQKPTATPRATAKK